MNKERDLLKARAEKAEARVAELERELKVYLAHIASCRDLPGQPKAREREAELERELQFAIDLIGPEYPGMWIAHKAREREAE